MSKLPRDLSSEDLCRALKPLGYEVTRQTGSHMRLTTREDHEQHVTISRHSPLRVGTVAAIKLWILRAEGAAISRLNMLLEYPWLGSLPGPTPLLDSRFRRNDRCVRG